MSTVEKIEGDIAGLSPSDLAAFRQWFIEFDAISWDRQFETDAIGGKLDTLAENALKDHASGRSTEF
ncbi:MAG TPA: hypothetical protein VN519_17000 [Bryobacteraceae bacterium]|nr:hypothetical protein [Bryobacteraceae bacterium]